ncbi:MAG: hypothetical protein ACRYGI_13430 [Janthinobacterium lividum]
MVVRTILSRAHSTKTAVDADVQVIAAHRPINNGCDQNASLPPLDGVGQNTSKMPDGFLADSSFVRKCSYPCSAVTPPRGMPAKVPMAKKAASRSMSCVRGSGKADTEAGNACQNISSNPFLGTSSRQEASDILSLEASKVQADWAMIRTAHDRAEVHFMEHAAKTPGAILTKSCIQPLQRNASYTETF